MLNEGIIIIAIGSPYYGRYAFNLAMTIKSVDPDYPVALVHNFESLAHLSEKQRAIFDHSIYAGDVSGFEAKLRLPEYTPFERTLYLDADMAWLPYKSPRDLTRSLKGIEFTAITEGKTDEPNPIYYFWAKMDEIKEVYGVESIYQWRSEVMYFEKTERTLQMFTRAREIHANPRLKSIHKLGDYIPDELAINIATAELNMEPHKYKWCPAYWPRMHGENVRNLESLYGAYFALSCGSNVSSNNTKSLYNRLVKAAAYKTKNTFNFPLINKKDFLKDRQIN